MALEEPELQPADIEDLSMRPMISVPFVPEDEDEPDVTADIETEFDPQYREPFIGLLYLGHLKNTVVKYGHSFSLATPTQRERLAAGVLHKQYINSIAGESAWASFVVAMYLESIDGQPLPEPIGPDPQTKVQDRFNWVIDNIHPSIINELFEECLLLDAQVGGALLALREASKASG